MSPLQKTLEEEKEMIGRIKKYTQLAGWIIAIILIVVIAFVALNFKVH
jgi:hypothetical protein